MTQSSTDDGAKSLADERWARLKPTKIGWLGREWRRFEREIRMAFEEGVERGVLDRRYEFVF